MTEYQMEKEPKARRPRSRSWRLLMVAVVVGLVLAVYAMFIPQYYFLTWSALPAEAEVTVTFEVTAPMSLFEAWGLNVIDQYADLEEAKKAAEGEYAVFAADLETEKGFSNFPWAKGVFLRLAYDKVAVQQPLYFPNPKLQPQ
jgi:hypothetical protein